MVITIKDQVGPRCIVEEDGQKIFDHIHCLLQHGETITLDFTDVRQFASPFFNMAIGQLLKDISKTELLRLLHIEHLNKTGKLVVDHVIENAEKYHADQEYRQLVDNIFAQQSNAA